MASCTSCKNGLQRFSDQTTMHGFLELYYAKSFVWKTIWFLAITGAIGVSVFQVVRLAQDTIEQPTTTVIHPLSSETQYPPMRFCYVHWIYWVDWNRTVELGFSKSSVLYAFGFLAPIITETDFNVSEAAIMFNKSMKENKMHRLVDFYDAVSFSYPPGVNFYNVTWEKWVKMFDDYHQLCYVATNEMIKKALAQQNTNKIRFSFDVDYHKIHSEFMSQFEELEHIKQVIKKFMVPSSREEANNLTLQIFSAPPFMNFDGIKEKQMSPGTNIFGTQVTVSGELFHWINTSAQKCNSDKSLTDHFNDCNDYCSYITFHHSQPSACLDIFGAWLLGIDDTEHVCRYEAHFLKSGIVIPEHFREYGQQINYNPTASYNECVAKYCTLPCDMWKYDSYPTNMQIPTQLQNTPNVLHLFFVSYQNVVVLEMYQVKSQTWATIVGNIGGIVGLWLGGSILSVLQMIYLLCFASCENNKTRKIIMQ